MYASKVHTGMYHPLLPDLDSSGIWRDIGEAAMHSAVQEVSTKAAGHMISWFESQLFSRSFTL